MPRTADPMLVAESRPWLEFLRNPFTPCSAGNVVHKVRSRRIMIHHRVLKPSIASIEAEPVPREVHINIPSGPLTQSFPEAVGLRDFLAL
jgi:hypothetical protein